MNSRPAASRLTRLPLAALLLTGAVGLFSQLIPSAQSQAPAPAMDPRIVASINALASQLKAQQDQMVEGQTKVEAQTATLREELRLLKIYSARGGSSLRR